MKKRFSILTVAIVGFLMMAVGVYAGEAFDRWVGEQHTQNTIKNLDAIDTGITKLKTDLEKKEQDLLAKQAEIDEANTQITSLEGRLGNSLEGVTLEELTVLISETNREPSLRKKYDKLKDAINNHVPETSKLNDHNDKTAEDNQLQKALEDVQLLETKSGEILESLNTDAEEEPEDKQ